MQILLVSKPLVPPWNDSGKNWARDIATYASVDPVVHHVLVPRGSQAWDGHAGVIGNPIYARPGRFAPGVRNKARALFHLLYKRCDAVHFCFAPNRRSNRLARFATTLHKRPSLHTILSIPASFKGINKILFSNQIVCVSHATAEALHGHGVKGIEVVPAAIPIPELLHEKEPERLVAFARRAGLSDGAPLVVFPGDYEFSKAADTFAESILRMWQHSDAKFVFACRIKQPESLQRETMLRKKLRVPLAAGRVLFLREVDDIEALLALAWVVVLPAESTYAKMDIPLVLLEALAQQTPIVIADATPLREVLGTLPEETGGMVVPRLDGAALAKAVAMILTDRTLHKALGEAGRRHVIKNHNAAHNCQHYTDIYTSLKG